MDRLFEDDYADQFDGCATVERRLLAWRPQNPAEMGEQDRGGARSDLDAGQVGALRTIQAALAAKMLGATTPHVSADQLRGLGAR